MTPPAPVADPPELDALTAPSDVDGLLAETPAGSAVDAVRAQLAWRCARRLARTVKDAVSAAGGTAHRAAIRTADVVGQRLEEMAPSQVTQWFTHPSAGLDATTEDDDVNDLRSPLQRAVASARHVTADGSRTGLLILTPDALPGGELYLPRLHAVLRTGEAVVALRDDLDVWRATWDSGFTLTLPLDPQQPLHAEVPGITWGLMARDIPVLNVSREITQALGSFGVLEHPQTLDRLSTLRDALDILDDIWPAARGTISRVAGGVVLLSGRGYARSHSPAALGCVLLTADHPYTVADLLCHETAHLRLQTMLAVDPLLEQDDERHPSPWRDDPRPLKGLLLGVHAFLDVITFYRRLAEAGHGGATAELVVARQTEKVRSAWGVLTATAQPTLLGRKVLEVLDREVAAL